VSPSWQASYSSLPFQAAGKLGGLTLKRQFETAFAAVAAAASGTGPPLDYLFVVSHRVLILLASSCVSRTESPPPMHDRLTIKKKKLNALSFQ
jgi:hypothetical protein